MTQSTISALDALPLSPLLIQVIKDVGITALTPIQAKSIPVLLQGKDLIGQSKTGSGKTAAFTLPILEKIQLTRRSPQALVLCPTRELCAQVAREMRKFGRAHPGLHIMTMAGGTPIAPQLAALEKGVHIIVGTPGRVLDHISRNSLDFRVLKTVVLDEADRMLDMGFEEDMCAIMQETPLSRQTVLFSATFPEKIEAMSEAFQVKPVRVTIEESGRQEAAIKHCRLNCDDDGKSESLQKLLRNFKPQSAIVFCNQRATVAKLAEELSTQGVTVTCLHGDLEQYDRDRAMARFRNQSAQVMIATDVAARGIDVQDLPLVVNYDFPHKPEMYVHRVGRTGRAGKTGIAVTLIARRDERRLQELEEELSMTLQNLVWPSQEEAETPAVKAMDTIYISGGRKDKMRPGDILGALTGDAGGMQAADVGKIEIHDRFSYVAVTRALAKMAVDKLTQGNIKGRKFRIELVK